jgi:hypothetical protein
MTRFWKTAVFIVATAYFVVGHLTELALACNPLERRLSTFVSEYRPKCRHAGWRSWVYMQTIFIFPARDSTDDQGALSI